MIPGGVRRATAALALGAAALLAGLGLGAAPLVPLGLGLVIAPLLAAAGVEAVRRGLRIEGVVDPARAVAGSRVLVTVRLSGWPVRTGLVRALEHAVEPGLPPAAGALARTGARRRDGGLELCWTLSPARRGEHRLAPPRVGLSDPLGLVARRVAGSRTAGALLCGPATVPVGADLAAGGGEGATGASSRRRRGRGLELDGVRDYLPGDPLSRVHWAQSARRGRLQTKELHATDGGRRPTVVLLDCGGRAAAAPEAFEVAVSAAASLARHLIAQGRRVALRHTGSAPLPVPGAGWDEIERTLARVAPDGRYGVAAALDELAARRPPPAAALVVAAGVDERLAAAVRRACGAGLRVACVLCGPAAVLAAEIRAAGADAVTADGRDGLAAALAGEGRRARR